MVHGHAVVAGRRAGARRARGDADVAASRRRPRPRRCRTRSGSRCRCRGWRRAGSSRRGLARRHDRIPGADSRAGAGRDRARRRRTSVPGSRPRVGQAPGMPGGIAVSQVSPWSTTPLPHVGEQSLSGSGRRGWRRPGSSRRPASTSSISLVAAASRCSRCRRGCRACRRCGRRTTSGQAPGSPGAIAVSQVSPGSTRPLPQRGLVVGMPPSSFPVPPSTMQASPPQSRRT